MDGWKGAYTDVFTACLENAIPTCPRCLIFLLYLLQQSRKCHPNLLAETTSDYILPAEPVIQFIRRGKPYIILAQNVIQDLLEIANPVRHPHYIRMHTQ